MKITELICSEFGIMTLNESDSFISEMANFLADVTNLPANIVLWTEPIDDKQNEHDGYRIKVYKNRIHCATYSAGREPKLYWQSRRKKFRLDGFESTEVKKVISEFSSLFIGFIDKKISLPQIKYEIKRIRGM